MAKALTVKAINALKPPSSRREIPDGVFPGLYLVMQPSGARSWALRYRHAGKPCKLTLGRYSETGEGGLSLADARRSAAEAIDAVDRGHNPAVEKRATKAAKLQAEIEGRDKVHRLLDEFERRHLAKIKSREQVRGFLDRFILAKWGERDIQSIKKRDIIDLLDEIADSGRGTTANRVLAYLRKFLNWCVERDILEISPASGVKPPAKENKRDRVLSDAEIRLFWEACDDAGQPFGPLGKLLLLTGQRRGEVGEMTDAEISGDLWHLSRERTKNGLAHVVPLSTSAQAILAGVERVQGKAGYLFTTTGKTPVSGFSKAHGIIAAKMGKIATSEAGEPVEIAHFTWHDLRRTCATGLQRLGFPEGVIEAALNHISGTKAGIVGVYQRHDYADEKRAALEAWGQAVADIVAGLDPVAEKKRRDDEAQAMRAQEALEARLALEAKRAQDLEIAAAANVVRLAGGR